MDAVTWQDKSNLYQELHKVLVDSLQLFYASHEDLGSQSVLSPLFRYVTAEASSSKSSSTQQCTSQLINVIVWSSWS